MKRLPHNSAWLVATILFGAILRFWNLDLKPLWLDETITALFSLGHSYSEVPLGQVRPLATFSELFQWQPASCAAIAGAIRAQSTHPPLFFCWLHQWLGGLERFDLTLAWKLRSLPALFGIIALPAAYRLNRLSFSPAAGLAAALLMAVSPFAVYLSQEARHYTLPMLLFTLSLAGLVLILQDLCEHQAIHPGIWFGWVLVNGLGFYIHYFYGLAVIAQVLTIIALLMFYRAKLPRRVWGIAGLAIAAILLIDLPLLPPFFEHLQRPATDWLNLDPTGLNRLAPLPRLLAGLIVMVVMLPVENQSSVVTIASGLIMLAFAGWLSWRVICGWKRLWPNPATRLSLLILGGTFGGLLFEYLLVIYGLGKDLTLAFRYNFLLYPPLCALIAAGLTAPSALEWNQRRSQANVRRQSLRRELPAALLVGLVSCGCVVSGLSFLKPFDPPQIVQHLQMETPTLVVQSYEDWQSVAFGLSLVVNSAPERSSAWLFETPDALEKTIDAAVEQPFFSSLWLFSALSSQVVFPATLRVQTHQPNRPLSMCQQQAPQQQAMNVRYQRYRCSEN